MAQDAIAAQAEIAKLRFQLARYRRAAFGRSSEKLEREAEQLELAIEALETDQAERMAIASPFVAAAIEGAIEARKPARRPLPEHLPREEMTHPAPCTCPTCGGALRRIGEEITETLDYVPGRFKVVRHIREKLSCRSRPSRWCKSGWSLRWPSISGIGGGFAGSASISGIGGGFAGSASISGGASQPWPCSRWR